MELVKPFVKWAGGKGSLIPQLKNFYPFNFEDYSLLDEFDRAGVAFANICKYTMPKERN